MVDVEIIPTRLEDTQSLVDWAIKEAHTNRLYMVEHKGWFKMVYKDYPKQVRVWDCSATLMKEDK